MTKTWELLQGEQRLLIEADLRPLQGDRFQPTGFADLGAATYELPDGTQMLLVESAQSVANRLEAVCWDEANQQWRPPLLGLPYVRVVDKAGEEVTNSVLEAHRLNSSYILHDKSSFLPKLQDELDVDKNRPVNLRQLARVVFKYDVNAVLHGVFISRKEIAGGRCKLPRLLSGFIEACDVQPVESGGVKNDRVDPSGDTSKGFGNVPFHRTEYVARKITAFFNLDLSTLWGYTLGESAEALLIDLALWKIQMLLQNSLRLRTACDFKVVDLRVTRPTGFAMPTVADLNERIPHLINTCKGLFADPAVTEVIYETASKKDKK